ncbi:MAG: SUKH-3 domain-containing protein [Lachnospiraceae bacterium]|nr:SUKH-3 domain-containing protein [Lachnospiraceae bacterium]
MNEVTLKRLRDAGWYKDRKTDISNIKLKYAEIGLEMPINISNFLEGFGFLKVNALDKKYFDVEFDPIKAIGTNLKADYFQECLLEYEIYDQVFPIGIACRNNLIVLMTEKSTVFAFTDGCLMKAGSSVDEMLDCIVGECLPPEDIE